jgi:hypothetical protein
MDVHMQSLNKVLRSSGIDRESRVDQRNISIEKAQTEHMLVYRGAMSRVHRELGTNEMQTTQAAWPLIYLVP